MKKITVQMRKASGTGPVINSITDTRTRKVNEVITPPYPLTIQGSTLKIMEEMEGNGVFFITEDGQTEKKAEVLATNNPSTLVVVPEGLADGMCFVEVRTHYNGASPVKNLRTYRFPIMLSLPFYSDEIRVCFSVFYCIFIPLPFFTIYKLLSLLIFKKRNKYGNERRKN